MQLKTIIADNMRDAMELIREAYGEDAIIVSSAPDEATGGIKVTAALDKTIDIANINDNNHLKDEDLSAFISPTDIAGEAFDNHSIPRRLGDKLLEEMEKLEMDDVTVALGSVFDARYKFAPIDVRDVKRPYILVGPPGVGKTLLTAKIAAEATLNDVPVRAITLDTVKAGGYEQLKSYMDAMGQPIEKASSTRELDTLIANAKVGELQVIDTTGVNPYDTAELEDLQTFIKVSNAEPILVLSAGHDALEAGEIAKKLTDTFEITRFIYTRLDITKRYGSALVIAEKAKLAFSHASLSPLVAEGFTSLNPLGLARLFVEGNR